MDATVKEEEDGNLICLRHNKKIKMIIKDNSVPFFDTFLCSNCIDEKPTISNSVIGISQAKSMINERHSNLDKKSEAFKQYLLENLEGFLQKIKDARSSFITNMDELLRITQKWIEDLQNYGKKQDQMNLLGELEQLYKKYNVQKNEDFDNLEKNTKSHLIKTLNVFKKLLNLDSLQQCFDSLKDIPLYKEKLIEQQEIAQSSEIQLRQPEQLQVGQLLPDVKQVEAVFAIAFNGQGSILVAGCNNDIKVWKFEKGSLVEKKKLKGHTNYIFSLVFSKNFNWFASGGRDNTIRSWKEQLNNEWINSQTEQQHNDYVMGLLLNGKEDQLISYSCDKTIKAWKVNCQFSQMSFDYTFENRHTDYVYGVSLNQSETRLVSCSMDKQIILWGKGENQQWQYQNHVVQDDFGYRICFIGDNQIAWQQNSSGYTHIFEVKDGNLSEKPIKKIKLNEIDDDKSGFPTIFNKKKQILIQKYGQFVYIIRKQSNGQFKIESVPIDCNHVTSAGALTEEGDYLVIWNNQTKEFRIYQLTLD